MLRENETRQTVYFKECAAILSKIDEGSWLLENRNFSSKMNSVEYIRMARDSVYRDSDYELAKNQPLAPSNKCVLFAGEFY